MDKIYCEECGVELGTGYDSGDICSECWEQRELYEPTIEPDEYDFYCRPCVFL